ncbi:hypothetical protein Q9L58_001951 [Maublancomyces gigas]|uniref:Uncharacterized protein n=1 Tax=Discina gigas TaxID=1032678 RepID=A0ABR3GT11_9PEZI
MAIFYVYLKWAPPSDSASAEFGRLLLTCESRYVADEFFRKLQVARNADGVKFYTLLRRTTPQFWSYATIGSEPWFTATNILGTTLLEEFGDKIMVQRLPSSKATEARVWPILPTLDGPDWVNNGAYFIRSKQRPNLYWHHGGDNIHVSETQMTKFRVRAVDFGVDDEKGKVLIGSDRVVISPIRTGTPLFIGKMLGCKSVCVSENEQEWRFDSLRGRFKIAWGLPGSAVLQWTNIDDGDDFVLC